MTNATQTREPTLAQRIDALTYDPMLWLGERSGMAARRARVLAAATGRVLEIGAGTGLNLEHYSGGIDELVLAEPDEAMARQLEKRLAGSGRRAAVVRASAEELPFGDDSFDTAVSTLVLCTVGDPGRAVEELRRVLRPGGRFLFIEHVRSDTPRLARWQDRLEKPWAAFASGCRCNRSTLDLLRARLSVDRVWHERFRGMPPIVQPLVAGEARA